VANFVSSIRFSDPYFSVLLMLVIGVGMAVAFVFLSQAIGPRKYDKVKYSVYECGVDPFTTASVRVSVKFYLIALLFILFDLESAFIYPWAVLFRQLGWFGFIEMGIFILILLAGLIYAWKKGALEWQ
jgi:NADH-quinone oxidoreductase subunit A